MSVGWLNLFFTDGLVAFLAVAEVYRSVLCYTSYPCILFWISVYSARVARMFCSYSLFYDRRVIWNIIRLENEHLNNVGEFRAIREIPLPFQFINSDDLKHLGDEDDDKEDKAEKKDKKDKKKKPVADDATPSSPAPLETVVTGGSEAPAMIQHDLDIEIDDIHPKAAWPEHEAVAVAGPVEHIAVHAAPEVPSHRGSSAKSKSISLTDSKMIVSETVL